MKLDIREQGLTITIFAISSPTIDASEINISPISTRNGRLNTYGGALLNTHKRKKKPLSFSSTALTFIRTPTDTATQERPCVHGGKAGRLHSGLLPCLPPPAQTEKCGRTAKAGVSTPRGGKKKKKKLANALQLQLSKCNFSSRCNQTH